jgi:hypothetical protein
MWFILWVMLMSHKVEIKVAPFHGNGPTTVEVTAIIPLDEDHVKACLVVEGEDYSSESCWEPDGDRSRYIRKFTRVPSGGYQVALGVLHQDGRIERAVAGFEVN